MPKIGMEPLRRKALIDATISAIGERGSLDVTMSDIAGRAGVSSALAHHYFGAKDDLLQATMRHLLADLGRDTAQRPARRRDAARARVSAVIAVNFSAGQFRPKRSPPGSPSMSRRRSRRSCAGCCASMRGGCIPT